VDTVGTVENQGAIGGICCQTKKGSILFLGGISSENAMDLRVQFNWDIREIGCLPGFQNNFGQVLLSLTGYGQRHFIYAVRQPILASGFDLVFCQEVDYGSNAKHIQPINIRIAQSWQFTRPIDLSPTHRLSTHSLVSADIAKIGLAIEADMPFCDFNGGIVCFF
jgi:hypothetical protein